MRKRKQLTPPTREQLEKELKRELHKKTYGRTLAGTINSLIVVAAMAILVATLVLPVLQIYGSSMMPLLWDGDVVVAIKEADFTRGDIVAFYYNNKILVKRVIALPGEWLNIDSDGNVYINDVLLDEPYLTDKALGECDIELPYQVPDGRVFVMGDNRSASVDSRSTTIGSVAEELVVGRLLVRVWPLNSLERIQ